MRLRRYGAIALGACLAVVLLGCHGLAAIEPSTWGSEVQTVQTIVAEANRWQGELVVLEGTVGDRAPFVEAQAYQLQDETGAVWVITGDLTIQEGDRLTIRGRVELEPIRLAGQDQSQIFVRETEQLDRQVANLSSESL